MSRPKKGTEANDRATAKWRASMIAKYGSEEALHKQMQKMGRAGGKISRGGGFTGDPERAKSAGKRGGSVSKRGFRFIGTEGNINKYVERETGEIVRFRVGDSEPIYE